MVHGGALQILLIYVSAILSHHIGVVTPCDQVVHHYDTTGIMCDHLTTDESTWMGTVLVPVSSPTHQRSYEQVIADLALQDDWSAERFVCQIM